MSSCISLSSELSIFVNLFLASYFISWCWSSRFTYLCSLLFPRLLKGRIAKQCLYAGVHGRALILGKAGGHWFKGEGVFSEMAACRVYRHSIKVNSFIVKDTAKKLRLQLYIFVNFVYFLNIIKTRKSLRSKTVKIL